MTTEQRMRQTIRDYRMLLADDSVVVGVSGGADSMALLHLLVSLWREEKRCGTLVAVHVQHNLRGEESDADETFVRETCAAWKVPLVVRSVDVPALAAQQGTGLEETGRQVRYAIFEEIAQKHLPCRIATAHNRRDNMETVLLHLTRGSGLRGSSGIAPVCDNRIRPLLRCSRQEIEAYCATQGIMYRLDSTNANIQYSRNRVRQQVVPPLEAINPRVEEAFWRFSEAARQDDDCLLQLAQQLVVQTMGHNHCYQVQPLATAHPALCVRALQYIAKQEACPALENAHMAALFDLLNTPGSTTLPGGRQVVSRRGQLMFVPKATPDDRLERPAVMDENYEFGGKMYRLSLVSSEEYKKQKNVHKILLKNVCDYAMISHSLHWRFRHSGDTYRPAGRPTKTLKKLMNEAGLPLWERAEMPVLCDAKGIVWTPFGCDERVAFTAKTTQIMLVTMIQDNENIG